MKAAVLEGNAINPGDISWDPLTSLADTTIYDNTTNDSKWDRLGGVDIVLVNKVAMTREVFERFPRIRYVGECATGYNNIDLEAAHDHGVTVTYVPAYSTDSVVQHTFALLLSIANKTCVHDASVKAGDWVRSETFCYWKEPVVELAGKTMGIVGYGNIGRGVARVARALGMRVLVHTAHPDRYVADVADDLRFCDVEELFANSDVISLHCPLTEQTQGLINARSMARMRDGVILLNLARGPIVVEGDLAAALSSGKVSGAGIDVVECEPMSPESPLLGAPNVVISPHIAWASVEARIRLVDIVAKNLEGWMAGAPQNVI